MVIFSVRKSKYGDLGSIFRISVKVDKGSCPLMATCAMAQVPTHILPTNVLYTRSFKNN